MTTETHPEVPMEPGDPSQVHVAPGPHAYSGKLTTRRMMLDVLIGLSPVILMSILVFQHYAGIQLAVCVLSCLGACL